MNKILVKETKDLCCDIDACIENIVYSRLKKDENQEKMAMMNMETLMVRTLQHLHCLLDFELEK